MSNMTPTQAGQVRDVPEESSFVNVEAWTEEAMRAIGSLQIASPRVIRGTSVSLSIPLDGAQADRPVLGAPHDEDAALPKPARDGLVERPSELRRRDSMKRRDAVLKGREGSRRRQRWENDRLLGNPHAQPPLPMDWEVRPTHNVHSVPYYLATLWDAKKAEEDRRAASKRVLNKTKDSTEATIGRVPKALKAKLKKSRGARGLLQDLEEEIRKFVESWEEKERKRVEQETVEVDSEDDEIVFVPKHSMHSRDTSMDSTLILEPEKLVFEGPQEDQSASFGRWLVHSIGAYYGLETWSVTVGNPARREAYVGIKEVKPTANNGRTPSSSTLPRPLWAMV